MTSWQESLDKKDREKLKECDLPDKVSPMLATLTDEPFSDPDWLFERKLDGERCIAQHTSKQTHLYSRKPKQLDATYPEIRDALMAHNQSFVVDGEVVAFEGRITSFSRLQQRMQINNEKQARASGIQIYYYLFDLLYYDGYDLTELPLRSRKRVLKQAFDFHPPLRLTAHRNESGLSYWRDACDKGWEGIIAKKADAPYRRSRSRQWLKFKCVNQQELVVVGYTDPKGSRKGFGALLLGYYEDDDLHYAGRVGTGFDEQALSRLHRLLRKREIDKAPIRATESVDTKGVHWVKPELVVEIGFTEWTRDRRLRHPRYLGLRDDKAPEKVVRETAD